YRQQLLNLASLIFTENFQEFNAYLAAAKADDVFTLLNKEVQEKTKFFLDTLSATIATLKTTFRSFDIDANDLKGQSRNKLIAASKISEHIYKTSPTDLQKIFARVVALLDNEEAHTTAGRHLRYDSPQALHRIQRAVAQLHSLLPTFSAY